MNFSDWLIKLYNFHGVSLTSSVGQEYFKKLLLSKINDPELDLLYHLVLDAQNPGVQMADVFVAEYKKKTDVMQLLYIADVTYKFDIAPVLKLVSRR